MVTFLCDQLHYYNPSVAHFIVISIQKSLRPPVSDPLVLLNYSTVFSPAGYIFLNICVCFRPAQWELRPSKGFCMLSISCKASVWVMQSRPRYLSAPTLHLSLSLSLCQAETAINGQEYMDDHYSFISHQPAHILILLLFPTTTLHASPKGIHVLIITLHTRFYLCIE